MYLSRCKNKTKHLLASSPLFSQVVRIVFGKAFLCLVPFAQLAGRAALAPVVVVLNSLRRTGKHHRLPALLLPFHGFHYCLVEVWATMLVPQSFVPLLPIVQGFPHISLIFLGLPWCSLRFVVFQAPLNIPICRKGQPAGGERREQRPPEKKKKKLELPEICPPRKEADMF